MCQMYWNDDLILRLNDPPKDYHSWGMQGKLFKVQGAKGSNTLQVVFERRAPSGLGWKSVGSARPATGKELQNDKLATALSTVKFAEWKLFNQKQWNGFGIKDLRADNFIKSGASYFKPIGKSAKVQIELAIDKVEDSFAACEDQVHN